MRKAQSKEKRTSYESTIDTSPETRKESTSSDSSDKDQQEKNPEAIESLEQKDDQSNSKSIDGITNSFDIALEYHEDLCAIVSDTVSAYCPWFVMHWFCYGATCLIGVICISEELTYSRNLVKLAYVSVFLVTHLYMFLLPCCCAAYITDTCGGMVLNCLLHIPAPS